MPVIVPGTVTLEQAISDIIESVALEQTGLSLILNAEGEKIQAAVAEGSIAEMLSVNSSVQSMVNAVASLEMVLQNKLNLFSCHICGN
ncbi:MAG: hypothetical protein RSC98_00905 [Clostridia bacterium]